MNEIININNLKDFVEYIKNNEKLSYDINDILNFNFNTYVNIRKYPNRNIYFLYYYDNDLIFKRVKMVKLIPFTNSGLKLDFHFPFPKKPILNLFSEYEKRYKKYKFHKKLRKIKNS